MLQRTANTLALLPENAHSETDYGQSTFKTPRNQHSIDDNRTEGSEMHGDQVSETNIKS